MNAHAKRLEPETIRRLRSLEPGQSFVYYRGNFDKDMNSCNADPVNGAAPNARLLLKHIQMTADSLARDGRIRLSTKRLESEYEYIAIGITMR